MQGKSIFILLTSFLVLLALACSASANNSGTLPVESNKGTVATLVAATDVAGASMKTTIDAVVAATFAAAQSAATPAAPEATPTLPPPTEPPVQKPAPSPTTPVQATAAAISLEEWKMAAFAVSSGCRVAESPCYEGGGRQDQAVEEMTLTSAKSLLIDPAWKNPTLVFWHKFQGSQPVYVNINTGSQWGRLKSFTVNSMTWSQVIIDLTKYKGKNISIQFSSPAEVVQRKGGGAGGFYGAKTKLDDWFLNAIQIVPNYEPTNN